MAPPGTHIRYDPLTARPRAAQGVVAALYRWLCLAILKVGGWRLHGDWPGDAKAVLIAAPHTSNWDGIWMLAAAGAWRVRLRYMGKKSLTEGPFGGFVRWTGCIPIDRSQSNDVVATMAAAFAATPRLILAVPPEGTRERGAAWKSGFYHIAVAANVPLVFAVLDYGRGTITLGGALWPTGDYEADIAVIAAHYAGAIGKYPAQFTAP